MGRTPKVTHRATPRVVAYVRVSTADQADSGAGLDAQRHAIATEIERRGWDLFDTYVDAGVSGKSLVGRTGLDAAIAAIECGDADVLIVSKLDRLSRSLLDFATLMARAQSKGWNLVALISGSPLHSPPGVPGLGHGERRAVGEKNHRAAYP